MKGKLWLKRFDRRVVDLKSNANMAFSFDLRSHIVHVPLGMLDDIFHGHLLGTHYYSLGRFHSEV